MCWCLGVDVAFYSALLFHFEVRMELGTGLEASVGVGIDVCTCVWVFVSMYVHDREDNPYVLLQVTDMTFFIGSSVHICSN